MQCCCFIVPILSVSNYKTVFFENKIGKIYKIKNASQKAFIICHNEKITCGVKLLDAADNEAVEKSGLMKESVSLSVKEFWNSA